MKWVNHYLSSGANKKSALDLSRIRLRPFAATDLPDLVALDARCFSPPIAYSRAELEFFIRHPRSTTTVAESADQIAGFCVVDWKLESGRKVGHFITIDVEPELRRNGLGRLLMETGESQLGEMGCIAVTLEVATGNRAAQAFYEHLGYQQTGRIPGYYPDGMDALVLRRPLRAS